MNDIGLRDTASTCLKSISCYLCLKHAKQSPERTFILDSVLLPSIRNGIQGSKEVVQYESISLLGHLVCFVAYAFCNIISDNIVNVYLTFIINCSIRRGNVLMFILYSTIYNLYLMKLILKAISLKIFNIYKLIAKSRLYTGKSNLYL